MKKINLFLIAALFSTNALASDVETEPNDSLKDASLISPSVTLNGQVSNLEDYDWFMFETNQSDILTFTISKSGSPYFDRLIQVVDADETLLYSKKIDRGGEESVISSKIGLKKAGKFFVIISSIKGSFRVEPYNYELTLNLENQAPFTVPGVADCPTIQNPRFSSATGILDFPAIDVDNVFGGLTTYKGSLELVTSPSGDMTFKIKEVSPK